MVKKIQDEFSLCRRATHEISLRAQKKMKVKGKSIQSILKSRTLKKFRDDETPYKGCDGTENCGCPEILFLRKKFEQEDSLNDNIPLEFDE